MNTIVLLVSKEDYWIKSAKAIINRYREFGIHADINIIVLSCDYNYIKNEFSSYLVKFIILDINKYPLNHNMSSLRKFMIFESDLLFQYQNILYLDCDMFVQNDFNNIFNEFHLSGCDFGFTYHRKIGQYKDFIYQRQVNNIPVDAFNRDLINGGFILISNQHKYILKERWNAIKELKWIYDQSIQSDRGIWDLLSKGTNIKKFSHVEYDFSLRLLKVMSNYRNRDKYYEKYFKQAKLIHFCAEKIWDKERMISGNSWELEKKNQLIEEWHKYGN